MNRRQFLAGATTLVAGAKTQRPNIVLMVADDLGWRDFGCYGNTDYETPAIDAVAREGMRFTNCCLNTLGLQHFGQNLHGQAHFPRQSQRGRNSTSETIDATG